MQEKVITPLKEKGNICLKDKKYEEAILHYSRAIKLDPTNHLLYSNRSLAFLKIQQFFLAIEDAKEAIRLKPDWAKGYYRKGEIEFQTFNYNDALSSYKIALTLQPNDPSLENALLQTKIALKREKAKDDQIPWIGAAIGIFIGAVIVIADQVLTLKPYLVNPILMCLLTFGMAIIGHFFARKIRSHLKYQQTSLLSPPIKLYPEVNGGNNDEMYQNNKMNPKYSKVQMKHRLGKGRS